MTWALIQPIWHGGAIWPPLQKKPVTCPLATKLGRILGRVLYFIKMQNSCSPRSLWRHSDVIMLMTSSKSVKTDKIGDRHNFWTNFPLIMVDPSFFMFWYTLSRKMHVSNIWSQESADVSSFLHPYWWWRHNDVTWRQHVGCRIFSFWMILFIDI